MLTQSDSSALPNAKCEVINELSSEFSPKLNLTTTEKQPCARCNHHQHTVDGCRFPGVTVSSSLKWRENATVVLRLVFFRQLYRAVPCFQRWFGAVSSSVLTFGITVWFWSLRVSVSASETECVLPPPAQIYSGRRQRKSLEDLKDSSCRANSRLISFPSHNRLESIQTRKARIPSLSASVTLWAQPCRILSRF